MDHDQPPKRSPLFELEREVLAEGQEWMRRRLEQKLQKLADQQGELSPPQRPLPGPDQTPDHPPAHHRRRRHH
jgi:hypothetical protein